MKLIFMRNILAISFLCLLTLFSPTCRFAYWLTGWANRIQINVDHTKIGSTLTNFPVMIYLGSSSGINSANVSSVFDVIGSNSKKIAITTADGTTQLYAEIVHWDSVNKQAWLYVKVPTLSSSADTVLYLYYDSAQPDNTVYVGDTGSTPGQAVWDSNFVAVYHLAESGNGSIGEYKDSTVNRHIATGGAGTASKTPGRVAANSGTNSPRLYSAQNFDGIGDYINIPDASDLSIPVPGDFTISAWVSPSVATFPTADSGIVDLISKLGGGQAEWQLCMYNQTYSSRPSWISFYQYNPSGGLGAGDFSTGVVSINQWVYATGAVHSTDSQHGLPYVYRDAAVHTGIPDNWSKYGLTYTPGNAPVTVGWKGTNSSYGYFEGRIGEVRISKTTRSSAWISASYYSDSDYLLTFVNAGRY